MYQRRIAGRAQLPETRVVFLRCRGRSREGDIRHNGFAVDGLHLKGVFAETANRWLGEIEDPVVTSVGLARDRQPPSYRRKARAANRLSRPQ